MSRPTAICFGTETLDYATQAKADFTWPGGGKQAQAVVVKSTLVLGHHADASRFSTETHSAYVRPVGFEPSVSVLPENNHSVVSLGTDAKQFATTHRDGFPARAIDMTLLGSNKAATVEINKAHFVLGTHPATFETTQRNTLAKGEDVAAVAAEKAQAKLAGRSEGHSPPKMGKLSSVYFGDRATDYSTANAMPLHGKTERVKLVDPSSWSSISTSSPEAAEVYRSLTTSGKPLSAVAFGYEKTAHVTDYMASTGQSTKRLREPFVPQLAPKWIKDHPALQGTPLAISAAAAAAALVVGRASE